jgi:hypothetical protein
MHFTPRSGFSLAVLACLAALALPAVAQQDRAAERAARRQELQIQQLQQQVTQAQAEIARVEKERATLDKEMADRVRAVVRAVAAERAALARLKVSQAEEARLQIRVADLETLAKEQRSQAESVQSAKDAELATAAVAMRTRVAERDQWQVRFVEQARLVTECSEKNDRLVRLGADLLSRWQGKGILDAMRQREPLLGLGDVQNFNLVQDYRDKTDNEKFVPRAAGN